MTLLKCLDCGQLFEENQDGLSDLGQSRPMCTRCGEEIDVIFVGEMSTDSALSDGTGEPYDAESADA